MKKGSNEVPAFGLKEINATPARVSRMRAKSRPPRCRQDPNPAAASAVNGVGHVSINAAPASGNAGDVRIAADQIVEWESKERVWKLVSIVTHPQGTISENEFGKGTVEHK